MKLLNRIMQLPNRSFFLLGPRSTGKTTWLKQKLPDASWYNLLKTKEFLRLSNTEVFIQEVSALAEGSWVVIDEVQRRPELLNEVHYLLNEFGTRYRFAMTGSSARKLKKENVNLLAGRASTQKFFPFIYQEFQGESHQWELEKILKYGCLPGICFETEELNQIEFLEAYTDTYLKEEIMQEAVVRNLDAFSRFLNIAGIMNSQILNTSNVSRDCHISRQTAENYFGILIDTLIGYYLPAWQPRAKVKEVNHPKFYFFDTGVVRALSGKLKSPIESSERGQLFETYIINEIRAYLQYYKLGGDLYYWRTSSGTEVDLIWKDDKNLILFEIKSSSDWKSAYNKGMKSFLECVPHPYCVVDSFGIYTGEKALKNDFIYVYPVKEFLDQMWLSKLKGLR